jgi:hypothetical protein
MEITTTLAQEDALGIFIPAYAPSVAAGFRRETIAATLTADEHEAARPLAARRTLTERLAHIRRLAGK